jgi:hypothetical protein
VQFPGSRSIAYHFQKVARKQDAGQPAFSPFNLIWKLKIEIMDFKVK